MRTLAALNASCWHDGAADAQEAGRAGDDGRIELRLFGQEAVIDIERLGPLSRRQAQRAQFVEGDAEQLMKLPQILLRGELGGICGTCPS